MELKHIHTLFTCVYVYMKCPCTGFQMRELCRRISPQEMKCCRCSRSYAVRVDAENSSAEAIVLPDTGSPEAHHLEETILFQQARNRRHILWQKDQYWLTRVHELEGEKCTPAAITSLAVALQWPIAVCNTRLQQSCVFLQIGAKPLCMCCALELCRRKRLLLLVHREACVFTVNPRRHVHYV